MKKGRMLVGLAEMLQLYYVLQHYIDEGLVYAFGVLCVITLQHTYIISGL
jgi:hypothetical protein